MTNSRYANPTLPIHNGHESTKEGLFESLGYAHATKVIISLYFEEYNEKYPMFENYKERAKAYLQGKTHFEVIEFYPKEIITTYENSKEGVHLLLKKEIEDGNLRDLFIEYPNGSFQGQYNMGKCQCGDVVYSVWWKEMKDGIHFNYEHNNWAKRYDFNIPYVGNAKGMVKKATNIRNRDIEYIYNEKMKIKDVDVKTP